MEDQISKLAREFEALKQWKETEFALSPPVKAEALKTRAAPLHAVLDAVLQQELSPVQRAAVLQYKGRALSLAAQYSKEAEALLTKAIKLDPRQYEAWLALGEVFWHKRDFDSAKNCFEHVLEHRADLQLTLVTRALRQLSMVLRQLGDTDTARRNNAAEAVTRANEAVALDVRDGISWYVLGNAHLTHFFQQSGVRANIKELRLALAAYKQAEAKVEGETKIDLLYNRAEVYRYLTEYGKAVEGYTHAKQLDPFWDMPKSRIQSVLDTCSKIQTFIAKKGNLKPKKLKELSNKLTDTSTCAIRDLVEGDNADKTLQVVVLGFVASETNIPYHVLVQDVLGEVIHVALYNVEPRALQFEDVLHVTAPHVLAVQFAVGAETVQYRSLVLSPLQLRVNGQPLSLHAFSAAEVLINPVHNN